MKRRQINTCGSRDTRLAHSETLAAESERQAKDRYNMLRCRLQNQRTIRKGRLNLIANEAHLPKEVRRRFHKHPFHGIRNPNERLHVTPKGPTDGFKCRVPL